MRKLSSYSVMLLLGVALLAFKADTAYENEIRGIAWSGRGKIIKVEVSTNAGKSWKNADLQDPVMDKAQVAFRYLWHWDGNSAEIMSRAVDETGYVQPFLKDLLAARGGNISYHFNPVTAWYLQKDGKVLFRPT